MDISPQSCRDPGKKKENVSSFQNISYFLLNAIYSFIVILSNLQPLLKPMVMHQLFEPPPTQLGDTRAKRRFHLVFA